MAKIKIHYAWSEKVYAGDDEISKSVQFEPQITSTDIELSSKDIHKILEDTKKYTRDTMIDMFGKRAYTNMFKKRLS